MALDKTEIIELIKQGVSPFIKECRLYAHELNMHITGKGIKEYTEKFNQHESQLQRDLRETLLKSNKATFSFLTRPLDKIFTAKGGSINYNLNESKIDELKESLNDISDGLDLKTYLKKVVKTQYLVDPNAFVMIDLDEEGRANAKIYTTNEVLWYSKRGNYITSVIFEAFENKYKEDKKKYYRVIDENKDSIFVMDGNDLFQQEGSEIQNYFGYVPAYILGDNICPNTDKFLSIIDDVLEDAKEHLRDVSVNIVHKLSHGYAKYWQYPEDCTTCDGTGEIPSIDAQGNEIQADCYSCNGSGIKNRKDASDLMLLQIPQDGEPVITTPGGYINPSIEVWKQYKEDIRDLRLEMFQTLWGSTYKTEGKNETATGRLLNVQPEAERVQGISKTFSRIHEFILTSYGKLVLGRLDYFATVSYGTRYLMESPDEVLNRYTLSKEKGLPAVVQQDLLDRFYQAEYSSNNDEYIRTKKILAVDPFPSMDAATVKGLGVSETELLKKIYYPQWVNQLTDAKKDLMSLEELKADLEAFAVNFKLEQNEQNERGVQGVPQEPTQPQQR